MLGIRSSYGRISCQWRVFLGNQSNHIKKPDGGYVLQHAQHRRLVSSNSQEQIYYGPLTPKMRAVKVFSLSTSIMGLAVQPILMEQGAKIGGTSMVVVLCGVAGFFTFVTPLLLHFISKKYVTEISYDRANDEYTAKTISIILTTIETKFKVNDVKVPDVPGMFTSFYVGNRPLFVDPAMFTDPNHYVKLMGYDKPIDFGLSESSSQDKVKEKNK